MRSTAAELRKPSAGRDFHLLLRAVRWEAANGWPAAVKQSGKFMLAETLEPLWSCVPASLGRVLWAVGHKSKSTINSGVGL